MAEGCSAHASRSSTSYDVIVLGIGGMGSAAAWALAKRGAKVLGLEQFELGHARGSSHGETRLIRQAYFEHPDYVPLLKRAYELWDELEHESGRAIFRKTGLAIVGPSDSKLIEGCWASAKQHQIKLEEFRADTAKRNFPDLSIKPEEVVVYEGNAGLLSVEPAVATMAGLARRHGAVIRENAAVKAWRRDGDNIVVEADGHEFKAKRLVITAGAWTANFVPKLAAQLDVRRVPVAWFPPQSAKDPRLAGHPCFGFDTPDGFYYGFPPVSGRGFKVGLHKPRDHVTDPTALDRGLRPEEAKELVDFVGERLLRAAPRLSEHAVCMYTMSPDEHFIIDRDDQVAYAAGFSGHGFKFATVVGEILAELSMDGGSRHPAGFLRYRW